MSRITCLLAMVLLALVAAAPAVAKDGDVLRSGSCTGTSSSKIKLSEEDGRIEAEFEVDENRSGVSWRVTLTQNGVRRARLKARTRGASGSFEVRRLLPDTAGADRVTGRAVSPSGEVCTATATF